MLPISENFAISVPKFSEALTKQVKEALIPAGNSPALECTFAAIHEGLTRNNTFYSKEGLTHNNKNDQGQPGGLESWTKPYNLPILKDHEPAAENVIGRVSKAVWVDKADGEPGHVELTAFITKPDAIDRFMRGEFQTGSIGLETDTATCSICASDFMKGWQAACEHERGKWYKKGEKGSEQEGMWVGAEPNEKGSRRMHVNIGNVWAREYSVVAVPSDAKSRVKKMELKEAYLTGESLPERLNLLSPVTEQEIPKVDKDGAPVENEKILAEKILAGKLSEIWETQVHAEGFGPVQSYFATVIDIAFGNKIEQTIEGEQVELTEKHLESYLSAIEETYPEHDSEFNTIKEAVLSSMKATELPDSAFAVVIGEGETKVRILPYRGATGSPVDQEKLFLAMSRVGQLDVNLTAEEQDKVLRRLTGVARRAGIAATSKEEAVAQATELLQDYDYKVISAEELVELTKKPEVPDVKALEDKLAASEAAVAEANAVLLEREVEVEELLDQVDEAKDKVQEAISAEKKTWIETIVTALGLEGQEADDKISELMNSTDVKASVTTTLEEKIESEILITAPVTKRGLAQGSSKEELSTENVPPTDETVIRAMFGNKAAQKQLFKATENLRT